MQEVLQRSSSTKKYLEQKQNHGQISFVTPSKKIMQETAQKTLKKSILKKLQSSKNNSAFRHITKRLQTVQSQLEIKEKDSQQITQQKQLILINQSESSPGFYEYIHWIKLNAQCFSYVQKKYIEEFWKILRLINYGEVLIPTGLIYQIFIDIKTNKQLDGFQKIINSFLKQNQTLDTVGTFKDLKNYIKLSQIQKNYKGIKNQDPNNHKVKNQRCFSITNVFQRNYSAAKTRTAQRVSLMCEGIIQKEKLLSSKPSISKYKSQSYNSLVRPERICHHSQKYKWKSDQQKYLEQSSSVMQNLFKAKKLDQTIFEGSIDNIPGIVTHLSRNKNSQAPWLQAKRQSQKILYSKKKLQ